MSATSSRIRKQNKSEGDTLLSQQCRAADQKQMCCLCRAWWCDDTRARGHKMTILPVYHPSYSAVKVLNQSHVQFKTLSAGVKPPSVTELEKQPSQWQDTSISPIHFPTAPTPHWSFHVCWKASAGGSTHSIKNHLSKATLAALMQMWNGEGL